MELKDASSIEEFWNWLAATSLFDTRKHLEMNAGHLVKHVLPPFTAVLLAAGILLLNKSGLSLLLEPLVALLVLTLAAAAWYLFRPRAPSSDCDRKSRRGIPRIVVPFLALFAGPGAAALLWGLMVFVIERDHYASTYERMENLPPALGVGLFVGGACFIVALVWATQSSDDHS
jgi:hypothetical protein